MNLSPEARTFLLLLDSAETAFEEQTDDALLRHARAGRLIDRLRALALAAYPDGPAKEAKQYKKPFIKALAEGQGVERLFEVSPETFRLWRTGEPPSRDVVLNQLDRLLVRVEQWRSMGRISAIGHLRDALAECLARLRKVRDAAVNKRSAYAVSEPLGYESDSRLQAAVDKLLYRHRPLLLSAYYDLNDPRDNGRLEAAKSEVLGIYYLWALKPVAGAGYAWWRQPLRVRYHIDINGQAFIRAKMSVPDARQGATKPFDYDGPVMVRDATINFVFESRTQQRQDFFNIIAGHPNQLLNGTFASAGYYLTVAQNHSQTIVAGQVVLELVARRHPYDGAAPEDHQLMREHAAIFRSPKDREYKRAQTLWEQASHEIVTVAGIDPGPVVKRQ